MAWTETLPSGKFRGCWRDANGAKQHTRRPEFPEHPYRRKKDALHAAQEAEVRDRRRAAAASGAIAATVTFGEWWEIAAPTQGHSNRAENSQSIAKNYLLPRWGEVPLNAITQRDVKAWVHDLGPNREPSYVQRIFSEFRRAINLAMDTNPPVLTASPCAGVRAPKVRRKSRAFLDEDYLATIADIMPAHYAAICRLGLETGLRPGELCGLHVDQVDLARGWLEVRRVYVLKLRIIRGYPKDADTRNVPLTDRAIDIIRQQLERPLPGRCGVPHVDGDGCGSRLVLANPAGDLITPEAWRGAMFRAARKLGVKAQSPYAARRGFATRAARGGMDAFELAEIMGHADIRQTRDYVQQSPMARDRLRAALGDTPRLAVIEGGRAEGLSRTNNTHGVQSAQSVQ